MTVTSAKCSKVKGEIAFLSPQRKAALVSQDCVGRAVKKSSSAKTLLGSTRSNSRRNKLRAGSLSTFKSKICALCATARNRYHTVHVGCTYTISSVPYHCPTMRPKIHSCLSTLCPCHLSRLTSPDQNSLLIRLINSAATALRTVVDKEKKTTLSK